MSPGGVQEWAEGRSHVGGDDRGGWQLLLCGRLLVHLSVGDAGISRFLRGQMGCACEERSSPSGCGVVSRL